MNINSIFSFSSLNCLQSGWFSRHAPKGALSESLKHHLHTFRTSHCSDSPSHFWTVQVDSIGSLELFSFLGQEKQKTAHSLCLGLPSALHIFMLPIHFGNQPVKRYGKLSLQRINDINQDTCPNRQTFKPLGGQGSVFPSSVWRESSGVGHSQPDSHQCALCRGELIIPMKGKAKSALTVALDLPYYVVKLGGPRKALWNTQGLHIIIAKQKWALEREWGDLNEPAA